MLTNVVNKWNLFVMLIYIFVIELILFFGGDMKK